MGNIEHLQQVQQLQINNMIKNNKFKILGKVLDITIHQLRRILRSFESNA